MLLGKKVVEDTLINCITSSYHSAYAYQKILK